MYFQYIFFFIYIFKLSYFILIKKIFICHPYRWISSNILFIKFVNKHYFTTNYKYRQNNQFKLRQITGIQFHNKRSYTIEIHLLQIPFNVFNNLIYRIPIKLITNFIWLTISYELHAYDIIAILTVLHFNNRSTLYLLPNETCFIFII